MAGESCQILTWRLFSLHIKRAPGGHRNLALGVVVIRGNKPWNWIAIDAVEIEWVNVVALCKVAPHHPRLSKADQRIEGAEPLQLVVKGG